MDLPDFIIPFADGDALGSDGDVAAYRRLCGGDPIEDLLAVAGQFLDLLQQPILGRLRGHLQLGQFAMLTGDLSEEVVRDLLLGTDCNWSDDILLIDTEQGGSCRQTIVDDIAIIG